MKNYLESRGFDDNIQEEWNLEPKKDHVLISYFDTNGKLLYKRENWPNGDPKYKSKYKTPPGEKVSLYNLQKIKDITDTLLLVEGEYNTISAWLMGYYGLGVPGQGNSLEPHLKHIPDTVKKIIILYDDPELALKRAKEILKYYENEMKVYIAKYPDGKDANDYLKEGDYIGFKAIMNVADRYMEDQLKSSHIKIDIPSGDFIEAYKDYSTQISDAPAKYQELMALTIISTLINRNVYLKWGRRNLYPNLYVVLIGKSTVMRKTEAISGAIQMINTINKDLVFPSEFSQEALFNHLSDNPIGIISWAEFGGFLAGATKSYKSDIKEFLTTVYDCPNFTRKKLVDKEYIIEEPFINIITATTIHWFADRITEADALGGFLGRFVYIPCKKEDKSGWYYMPQPEPVNSRNMLISKLNSITGIKGEFTISDEAITILMKYLRRHDDEIWGLEDTKGIIGFYGRLADYVFKFAMLYEISAYGTLIISENSVLRAIRLVNYLKQALRELLGDYVSFSQDAKDIQRVLNVIKNSPNGDAKREKLNQNTTFLVKRLDEILETLKDSKRIAEYRDENKARHYRIL